MPRTITRTGRQRAALAAGSGVVADVLSDPAAVTELLGDLLDQERSVPDRWVVPRVRLAVASFDVALKPRFNRDGDTVRIDATSTRDSDATAHLRMQLAPEALGDDACRLTTTWQLELRVGLPRAALRLAGPALDRTIASTVRRIMHRTEAAVLRAEAG